MECLYRCQRQTDALRVFREGREALEEQLGLEPGQRLSELEFAILNHDPNLDFPAIDVPSAGVSKGVPTPATLGTPAPIPRAMSTLVGRQADIEDIVNVVGSSPVTTLVGVGGCGKTRLAWAVAERLAPTFSDGVFVTDLTAVTDSREVEVRVSESLGIADGPGSPTRRIATALEQHRVLLLLELRTRPRFHCRAGHHDCQRGDRLHHSAHQS